MSRLPRLALWSILFVLGASLVAGYVFRARLERLGNRKLAALIVARVAAQSGVQIIATATTTSYWGHLRVYFDHPLLVRGGRELCRLSQLTLVFSYHALLFNHGLPLLAIDLRAPWLSLSGTGEPPVARPDAHMVAQVRALLRELAGITRDVEVEGGQIELADGRPLAQDVRVRAQRPLLRVSPWHIDVSARLRPPDLLPLRAHLELQVDARPEHAASPLARGTLWLAQARLDGLAMGGVQLSGALQARSTLTIDGQGQLEGALNTQVAHLLVAGTRLRSPLSVQDA